VLEDSSELISAPDRYSLASSSAAPVALWSTAWERMTGTVSNRWLPHRDSSRLSAWRRWRWP